MKLSFPLALKLVASVALLAVGTTSVDIEHRAKSNVRGLSRELEVDSTGLSMSIAALQGNDIDAVHHDENDAKDGYYYGYSKSAKGKSKKGKAKSGKAKSAKAGPSAPGYCGETVFLSRSDVAAGYRAFEHGAIKYGKVECNSFNQCVGDIVVTEPVPVYSDREITNKIGVYMSTQTMLSISDNHSITLGEYVVEFDDGILSEILFGGEQTLDASGTQEEDRPGDFPITGGIGEYLGVEGEVFFFGDGIDVNLVDLKIVCL